MPDQPSPIVEFCDVSLCYGEVSALRDISFSLFPGETHIILGAAGSGKTTLLKAVIGLVCPDEGTVKLFDQEITALKENELFGLRSRAGIVLQEGGLFDSLSIGENVEYPLLNQQTSEGRVKKPSKSGSFEDTVRETLRFVELEHTFDKFPSEVSGGMRRRVGIARAIVTEPPLVLYDSPTAGLDPITANTIMALIAKERDTRDTAALIVTHRYQDGELMANFRYDAKTEALVELSEEEQNNPERPRTKFMVMKEGEVVFFGTRQELESSTDEYVRRFVRHEA